MTLDWGSLLIIPQLIPRLSLRWRISSSRNALSSTFSVTPPSLPQRSTHDGSFECLRNGPDPLQILHRVIVPVQDFLPEPQRLQCRAAKHPSLSLVQGLLPGPFLQPLHQNTSQPPDIRKKFYPSSGSSRRIVFQFQFHLCPLCPRVASGSASFLSENPIHLRARRFQLKTAIERRSG